MNELPAGPGTSAVTLVSATDVAYKLFCVLWAGFGAVLVYYVLVPPGAGPWSSLFVAYLAVIVGAGLWPLYRAGRLGVRLDDSGATIRRLWRTEQYGWPEISQLADGVRYQRAKRRWALAIVLRNGQVRTVPGTGMAKVRPAQLAVIGQLAAAYAVPADLTGTPRRIWGAAAAQVALSAAVIAYGFTSSSPSPSPSTAGRPPQAARPAQVTWAKVRAGDCLRGELLGFGNGTQMPDTVTPVPCRQPHLGEVIFTGDAWPAGRPYPGDGEILDQANHRCARELTGYEATKYQAAFTYQSIEPGWDSWGDGDRSLTCIAYSPSQLGGALVSYSIKSRGR